MALQAQERAHSEADVAALCCCRAVLDTLNATELFRTAMIFFNPPQPQGFIGTPLDRHGQVSGRPVFNAPV